MTATPTERTAFEQALLAAAWSDHVLTTPDPDTGRRVDSELDRLLPGRGDTPSTDFQRHAVQAALRVNEVRPLTTGGGRVHVNVAFLRSALRRNAARTEDAR